MRSTRDDIAREIAKCANPERAAHSMRFFRTGEGEYGAGDQFLGLTVPQQRQIAAKFADLPLDEVEALLGSPIHEHRLTALLILVRQFQKAKEPARKIIVDLFLRKLAQVNNWDLVDSSAPQILGTYLLDKDRKLLRQLANSENLWDRRIAIVATQALIRKGDLADTFRIAKMLLKDRHDLIHKATGWMLREAGGKNEAALLEFLEEHRAAMPRTALRYAIEKFPPDVRARLLARN